ncbi:MAG TPA: glycosyltransferase family 4 protein [Polyangiales bacterium]|nr:glycosyltransferase family 4 protein [Polyangiales bacterium]
MHRVFVTPPLDGPATGGTLYNRQLLAAVDDSQQFSLAELPAQVSAEQVWVDSLYLAELPALRRRLESTTRVGLLLHYLPSLLSNPQLRAAKELSDVELRALEHADMVVTPSEYLRQLVLELCPGKPCACVGPGVEVPQLGGEPVRDGSALMICNVTENKGVLPFLQELALLAPSSADFELSIAGSLQLETAYARTCVELCQQGAWLRAHVRFVGSLPQPALFLRLARASVLVSASRFESYGMALAEARALGTPILALEGGNVANMLAADSGGELTRSPRALAHALCQLMSDPRECKLRLERARSAASVRPWRVVALEFDVVRDESLAAGSTTT